MVVPLVRGRAQLWRHPRAGKDMGAVARQALRSWRQARLSPPQAEHRHLSLARGCGVLCNWPWGFSGISEAGDAFLIRTSMDHLFDVVQAVEEGGVATRDAELTYTAQNSIDLDPDKAASVSRLLEKLDDDEDVQKLHVNASFPEEG